MYYDNIDYVDYMKFYIKQVYPDLINDNALNTFNSNNEETLFRFFCGYRGYSYY